MKAKENEGKKLFIIFILLVVTYSLIGMVSAAPADPGHGAPSIGPGTFEGGHYIFPNNLSVTENFSVDTDTLVVDSVLHRIGIGTGGPQAQLHVEDDVKLAYQAGYNATFFENAANGENPYVYIYGWADMPSVARYGRMFVDTSGYFNIDAESAGIISAGGTDVMIWGSAAGGYATLYDNVELGIGTNSDARHQYDENTNDAYITGIPAPGGGTKRGWIIVEQGDIDSDFTSLLSTTTQPRIALLDEDIDSYLSFTWDIDDVPEIGVGGGASDLYMNASVNATDFVCDGGGCINAVELNSDVAGLGLNTTSGVLAVNIESPGGGIVVSGDAVVLNQSCSDNEILKWDSGSSTWECSSDDQGGTGGGNVSGSGSANHVAFWKNDQNITYDPDGDFYWDSSSNRLGIGTTAPDTTYGALHINDSDGWSGIIVENQAPALILKDLGGSADENWYTYVLTGTLTLGTVNDALGSFTSEHYFYQDGSVYLSNVLYTDDTSDRVGIGWTSPEDELSVKGTANATDFVCASGSGGCINAVELNSDVAGLGLNTTSGVLAVNIESPGGGIVVSNDAVVLNQSCTDGQILKWDNVNSVWNCSSDVGVGSESDPLSLHVSGGSNAMSQAIDMNNNNIQDIDNLYTDDSSTNFFSGACSDNQHITGISSAGAISCGTDTGDIAGITTTDGSSGLDGGCTSGTCSLTVDVTDFIDTTTGGLTETSNEIQVNAGDGIDVSTDVDVDVTDLIASGQGVEEIATNNIGLNQSCTDGQILKWDNNNNVWNCSADTGGIASESDTLQDVTGRGNTTTEPVTIDSDGDEKTTIGGNLTVASDTLFVDSDTARVGIGTASPSSKLTAYGDNIDIEVRDDGGTSVTLGAGNSFGHVGTDTNTKFSIRTNGGDRITVSGTNVGIGTGSPSARLQVHGSGTGGLSLNVTNDLFVNDTSGNVGIGTTNPDYSLHVVGSIISNTAQPTLFLTETDTTNENWKMAVSSGKLHLQTMNDDYGVKNTRFTIQQDGNVGIGTASPNNELEIVGDNTLLHLDSTGNIYSVIDRSAANRRSALVFLTAGDPSETIPATGFNWGVGVADSDDAGDGTEFFIGTDTSGANAKFWIETSGNVGIGTTTVPHGGIGDSNTILAIDGSNPVVQITDTGDDYPTFGIYQGAHDDVAVMWDAYIDSGTWKSSDAGSNFWIYKFSDGLNFMAESGIAQGSATSYSTAMTIQADADVVFPTGSVGIGWTSPEDKLSVKGTANATDFVCDGGGCINAAELNSDVAGLGLNTTSGVLAVNILSPGGGILVSNDQVVLNQSCSDGEVLKWDNVNSVWNCSSDVGVGSESDPLSLHTSGGSNAMSQAIDMNSNNIQDIGNLYTDDSSTNFFSGTCSDNQHITGISSAGAISCGTDTGDIAGITTTDGSSGLDGGCTSGTCSLTVDVTDFIASNKGLAEIATNNLGLLQTCSNGQVLKSDASNDWSCADDNSGGEGWSVSGTYVYNDTAAVTVGIGNNTPVTKLAISYPSNQLGIIDSDGGQEWRISANSDMLFIEDENTGAIPFKIEDGADTDTLLIDDAGNVGIGTTAPGAPLHIDASTTAEALFINSSSTDTVHLSINSTSSVRQFDIGVTGSAHSWGSDRFYIWDATAGGDSRLIIDASGNIGINNTNPSYILDAVGNAIRIIDDNPRFILESDDANTARRISDIYGTGGSAQWRFYKEVKGSDPTQVYMTISSGGDVAINDTTLYADATNGRVGIGTASPNTKLQVYGTGNTYVNITDSNGNELVLGSNAVVSSGRSDGNLYIAYNQEAGDGTGVVGFFGGGTTQRARIEADGDLQLDGDIYSDGGDINLNADGSCGAGVDICRTGGDTQIQSDGGDVIIRLG